MPVDEVVGERRERAAAARRQTTERERAEERRLTRGRLLGEAAVAGAALAGVGVVARSARAASTARVAIVGAGLAGIRCAHRLWTAAPGAARPCTRPTRRTSAAAAGAFAGTSERSRRRARRSLHQPRPDGDPEPRQDPRPQGGGRQRRRPARRRGDLLVRRRAVHLRRGERRLGRTRLSRLQGRVQARTLAAALRRQHRRGPAAGPLSVPEWLDETGIASSSRFGRLLLADVVSEYGGDPSDQPALNLLYLLAWNSPELTRAASRRRREVPHRRRQRPDRDPHGRPASLGLDQAGPRAGCAQGERRRHVHADLPGRQQHKQVTADHVVLALPFSTLREVDLSQRRPVAAQGAGDSAARDGAEREAPPAGAAEDLAAARLQRRQLHGLGRILRVAWDDSVPLGDSGPAILLGFPGGLDRPGRADRGGPRPGADAGRQLVPEPDRADLPGHLGGLLRPRLRGSWSVDPWHRGAYSYWRLGEYTAFSGYEGIQEGNIHFAGEHTDPEEQGFLNGAVNSGERAASEVMHQRGRA